MIDLEGARAFARQADAWYGDRATNQRELAVLPSESPGGCLIPIPMLAAPRWSPSVSTCRAKRHRPAPSATREDDFANPSAFYSRTKYAADLVLSRLPAVSVVRLRMPVDTCPSPCYNNPPAGKCGTTAS